jgi:hypothetical protein
MKTHYADDETLETLEAFRARVAELEKEREGTENGWGMEALQEQLAAVTKELEVEHGRLAACGVAALGYFEGCADEYRSASLEDVLALKDKLAAVTKELDELKVKAQFWLDADGDSRARLAASQAREQQLRDSIKKALKGASPFFDIDVALSLHSDTSALDALTKDAELYKELLYAVGSKYPNETRHQTALRYIRRAEEPCTISAAMNEVKE